MEDSADARKGSTSWGTSLNFTVTGYVGGEPQVASFSVAINRKTSGGKKQTLWIRVNCWNRLADAATRYIRKGSLVQISAVFQYPLRIEAR